MRAARTIRGHAGIGPRVTGEALVARDDFSARYDLDRVRGVFSRPAHRLHGESYVGRVLVLDTAKGGVATSWMLREMCARGMGPAALLLNLANPIMAQGAAFADLPFMDRFECDITGAIATGDRVTVDPGAGEVTVEPGGSRDGPRGEPSAGSQTPRGAPILTVGSSLQSGFRDETYEAATGTARRGFERRPAASNMSRRSEAQPR